MKYYLKDVIFVVMYLTLTNCLVNVNKYTFFQKLISSKVLGLLNIFSHHLRFTSHTKKAEFVRMFFKMVLSSPVLVRVKFFFPA
jgi:hypothetical protein